MKFYLFIINIFLMPVFVQAKVPCEYKNIKTKESVYKGNAGCFIKYNGKLLHVKDAHSGKYSIPGGGPEKGENALCTAWRETFEETGVSFGVGRLIKYIPETDFYIFKCYFRNIDNKSDLAKLGTHLKYKNKEISGFAFWDPGEMKKENMRFPGQYNIMRSLLNTNLHSRR